MIAGEDGRIAYGSNLSLQGFSLTELGAADGLSPQEGEAFDTAYREHTSGSFSYAVGSGRNYTAWAPVSYTAGGSCSFPSLPM